MNQVLLFPEDYTAVNEATLWAHSEDPRATHIHEILKAVPGQKIKVGLLNTGQGLATIVSCDRKKTVLEVSTLSKPKPSPFQGVTLLVALPRPQTLKKVLETAATFGVGEILFVKTARVEKSFFQSTLLKDEAYRPYVYFGLQQGGYVTPPKISFFLDRTFWETVASHPHKYIAHPSASAGIFTNPLKTPLLLAIGPEGGWLDEEVSLFVSRGFQEVSLGRTLHRVENAVCAALAQIELLKGQT